MSGDRDARVRLNLEAAGFVTGLRAVEERAKDVEEAVEDIGDGAEKASRKTGLLSSSMKSGFGAAKSSLAELGSTLKSTLATAATLGGALSVGTGLHKAEDLIESYKNMAFALEAGTGAAKDWREIQADVEGIGGRWKLSNDKVAASYRALYDDIGDLEFAKAATEEVAKAHVATGASMESLTAIAGQLNEKFSVTGKDLPDAMAAVISAANKGGVGIDDLAGKLGAVGASAKLLGMEGKAGLGQVIGMLNLGDAATGSFKKNVSAVSALLDTFADPDKVKAIEKSMGVKLTTKTGDIRKDALDTILKKSGGASEKLALAFTGDALKLATAFGSTYQKAFTETEGTVKQKTAAALEAYKASLAEAGKQTLNAAQLDAQATERLADPKRQLDDALNKFTKAFENEKVIHAVEKLADKMPQLAEVLGDVVGFAADHPMLAGAAFVGAKPLASGGASFAGEAIGGLAKAQWKSFGAQFAAAAAADSKWAGAGKLMSAAAGPLIAVAIAAAVGMALKEGIDSIYDTKAKDQGDLAAAQAEAGAAAASGDKARMKAADDRLAKKIAEAKDNAGGVSGFLDTTFGGVAHMLGAAPLDTQADVIARAEADRRSLQQRIAGPGGGPLLASGGGGKGKDSVDELHKGNQKAGESGQKAAQALERAAASAERFARSMDRVSGSAGSSTNGLPAAPGNSSGSGAG